MDVSDLGKWLVVLGLAMAVVGGVVWLLGRASFLENLPGTIRIQTETFSCIIPLGAMLLVSLIGTVLLNIVARWLNK
jgi:hypothetical protein